MNAVSCGSDNQIHYLVKHGIVGALSGEMLCDSTMVTMALEGLERVLRVGEAKAGRNGKMHGRGAAINPYAALLSEARKARSLTFEMAMKSPAAVAASERTVCRQATRVWDEHFVTCAICQTSSSKAALNTEYCEECRGIVCSNCDCSVYHLSYQEKVWDDVSLTEEADKSKRKKKKKRQKKDKRVNGKASETSSVVTGKVDETQDMSSSDDEYLIPEEKLTDKKDKSSSEELLDYRNSVSDNPPQVGQEVPIDNDGFEDEGPSDDDGGVDLVDYLQSTGSILALAQKLGF